ncbi:MAG: hypothetical protein IIZ87_03755, partial [Selenomonas sp.]|nr:hypothetical protein [Selenomonas sp.]
MLQRGIAEEDAQHAQAVGLQRNGQRIVPAENRCRKVFAGMRPQYLLGILQIGRIDPIQAHNTVPYCQFGGIIRITISQAVVAFDEDFGKAIDNLEALLKVQRNKPSRSVTSGLIGIKRANNTGLPVVCIKEKIFKDEPTLKKEGSQNVKGLCEKSFGKDALIEKRIAYNISDITDKNDWIAIIHADGNGLGKVVQKVG